MHSKMFFKHFLFRNVILTDFLFLLYFYSITTMFPAQFYKKFEKRHS